MKIPHLASLGFTLGIIWLLLSGHYTSLLLTLGLVSIAFVLFISQRMDVVDHEGHPIHLNPLTLVFYLLWLVKQIFWSNLDVFWRILHPKLPISPQARKVKCSQVRDLGRVIYANSITLTPGTVSLDVDSTGIEVHALTAEGMADLESGEMNNRVSNLERHS